MSMKVTDNYGGYAANQTSGTKKFEAEKVEEMKPEIPVSEGETPNRDTLIFSSSPYAKSGYNDYINKRIQEVAQKLPELAKNADHSGEIKFSEWYGQSVNITISEDSQRILDSVAERKEAQRAAMEAFKAESPENPFIGTGSMKSQHLVFTEELYNNGFYDDMSDEEVKQIQGILQDITAGMTEISGGHKMTNLKNEMTHEAARFELMSSVSALRHFSEKFVPEDMQESFSALIDKYEQYNSARVAAHKSIYEMRDESMKDLPKSQGTAKSELASVKHTDEQKKANEAEYLRLFEELKNRDLKNGENADDIFADIRKTFIDYTSGGSKNEAVIKLLNDRNANVLKDMSDYWTKLLTHEKEEKITVADEEEIAPAADGE